MLTMEIDKLKIKILDISINGGLVKNNKSSNRINCFKEENDYEFDIPSNWIATKLSNVCSLEKGEVSSSGELPYLETKYLRRQIPAQIKDEGIVINPGDYVILVDGENSGEVFKITEKGYMGSTFKKLLIDKRINSDYLLIFLKKQKQLLKNRKKGSAIPHLNPSLFKSLIIPLPPYEEQERIVEKYNMLECLISELTCSYEKIQNSKNTLKQVLFDKAIHAKLVSNDIGLSKLNIKEIEDGYYNKNKLKKDRKTTPIDESEIPYEIPSNWIWTKLGNLGVYKKGPFGSSLTKSMFVPDGEDSFKVYEQQNAIKKDWKLGKYFITREKYESMKSFEVKSDDIIVSCAGTIGETYIIPSEARKGIINQALMKITLFDNQYRDFFLLYFDYVLKKEANEKGKGTAMKNIPPFDVLKNMYIPIPPIEEQKRIITRLNEMIDLIEQL